MKFLKWLFGKEKKDKSWERLENYLDELPTVEKAGKRFAIIDSENDSIPKLMGEFEGIQYVEDSAVENVERGDKYREEGRYQEAMREYESAIRIEPNYVDAHHSVAINYLSMERFDEALKEFKHTLRLAEQYIPVKGRKEAIEMILGNICTLLRKRGLTQNTIGEFMEVIKNLKNPPPMYHCALGILYEELGFKNKVINEYKKLLSLEKTGQWADLARERLKQV